MFVIAPIFILVSTLLVLDSVQALPWDGPDKTITPPDLLGWTPKPTQAPIFPGNEFFTLPRAELLFRREIGVNTCGYQDKNFLYPRSCDPGYVCISNPANNVIGCCTDVPKYLSICRIYTSCIDSTAIPVLCTDKACEDNPFINFCTSSQYPKCKTYYYNFGSVTRSELQCDSTTGRYTFYPTYKGASTFTGFQISAVNRVTLNTLSQYEFYTPPSSGSTTSTPPTSSAPVPPPVPNPTTSAPVVPTPSPSSTTSSSSTNVGAIAGGAVGGAAVLAIVLAGLIWLCLRRKKQSASGEQPAAQPDIGSGGGPAGYAGPPSYNHPHSPGQQQQEFGSATESKVYSGYFAGSDNKPDMLQTTSAAGNTGTMSTGWSGQGSKPVSPALESPPLEADSQPVMTGQDGRPVFEIHSGP